MGDSDNMTNASVKPSLVRIEKKLDKVMEELKNENNNTPNPEQEQENDFDMSVCDDCKEEMKN